MRQGLVRSYFFNTAITSAGLPVTTGCCSFHQGIREEDWQKKKRR